MADRVVLFVDWQNLLMSARSAFHRAEGRSTSSDGQIDPIALGQLICTRPPSGRTRELHEVRIYRGEPSPNENPKMHAAHAAQRNAWEQAGARVITRPLQYLRDRRTGAVIAHEKGVDVQIAVDLVTGAVDGRYDIGIVFSGDTDLRPALEYVANRFSPIPRVEVAAWDRGRKRRGLTFNAPGGRWCHYLSADDYRAIRDTTSYASRGR